MIYYELLSLIIILKPLYQTYKVLGSSRATKFSKNITFAVNCCHFYQSKDSKYFLVSLKPFILLMFLLIEHTLYFARTRPW